VPLAEQSDGCRASSRGLSPLCAVMVALGRLEKRHGVSFFLSNGVLLALLLCYPVDLDAPSQTGSTNIRSAQGSPNYKRRLYRSR
jgi:hypothetical protein